MNIVELTLITTIVVLVAGIIYISFTEVFVEEERKKRLVTGKSSSRKR